MKIFTALFSSVVICVFSLNSFAQNTNEQSAQFTITNKSKTCLKLKFKPHDTSCPNLNRSIYLLESNAAPLVLNYKVSPDCVSSTPSLLDVVNVARFSTPDCLDDKAATPYYGLSLFLVKSANQNQLRENNSEQSPPIFGIDFNSLTSPSSVQPEELTVSQNLRATQGFSCVPPPGPRNPRSKVSSVCWSWSGAGTQNVKFTICDRSQLSPQNKSCDNIN